MKKKPDLWSQCGGTFFPCSKKKTLTYTQLHRKAFIKIKFTLNIPHNHNCLKTQLTLVFKNTFKKI